MATSDVPKVTEKLWPIFSMKYELKKKKKNYLIQIEQFYVNAQLDRQGSDNN